MAIYKFGSRVSTLISFNIGKTIIETIVILKFEKFFLPEFIQVLLFQNKNCAHYVLHI